MYLQEILERAILKNDPDPDREIVLVSKDSADYCDIPMVITRKDWEDIYVQRRAAEPDIEVVAMAITRGKSKPFMTKFAAEEVVQQKYVQLRTALDEEVSAEEETSNGGGSMLGDFGNVGLNGNFEVPDSKDEFAVEESEVGVKGVPADEQGDMVLTEKDSTEEFAIPLSAAASNCEGAVRLCPEEQADNVSSAFEEANSGDTNAVTVIEQQPKAEEDSCDSSMGDTETPIENGASQNGVETGNNPVYENEGSSSEVTDEKDERVAFEPVAEESTHYEVEQQLATYLDDLENTGMISTDVAEWAFSCSKLFSEMEADFDSTLKSVRLGTILETSGYTEETFIAAWRDKDPDAYVKDISELKTYDQFVSLFRWTYADCLRYLAAGRRDTAITLAKLFASLIYEEE